MAQSSRQSNTPVEEVCDWLELVALASDGRPLSMGKAQEYAAEKKYSSVQIEQAFLTAVKRARQLGNLYPFTADKNHLISKKDGADGLYATMLLVSPNSDTRKGKKEELNQSAKLFEIAAEHCFRDFFGANTETVNFGHPSIVGRPQEFGEAVKWIAAKLSVNLGSGFRPPRMKDGGVDIFVWKRFIDGFPGAVIMLLQCTVKSDFKNKIGDIDLNLWASWLSSDLNPLAGLCVPMCVADDVTWNEVNTRGILFDRMRLCGLAKSELEHSGPAKVYLQELLAEHGELVL